MSESDTPNTKLQAMGGLSVETRLERIEDLLKQIVDQLVEGKTILATLSIRLRALEFIVYGACGLGLCALVGAVLMLVVKKGAA